MDCGPLDDLILTDGEDPRLSIYIAAAGQLAERERERERGQINIGLLATHTEDFYRLVITEGTEMGCLFCHHQLGPSPPPDRNILIIKYFSSCLYCPQSNPLYIYQNNISRFLLYFSSSRKSLEV